MVGVFAASVCLAAIVVAAASATRTHHQATVQNTPAPSSAVKGYTKGLPPKIAALYKNSYDILGPSVYRNWQATKPPWTICFNNSYLGNTWRAASLQEFNAQVATYKKAGLVDKSYATNSNLSLPTQITQFRDMINVDKCDGIITIPTGTSGQNAVIEQAVKAGIPVVDDLGPTTSPYAANFDENFVTSGMQSAEFLAKAMHYKGNLLDIIGIPGETISVEYQLALNSVLKKYPNIHIIGKPVGKVTDTIAQSAVLQFLSTHPQPVQGVYQEGGMGAGALAAFKQTGRPTPALMFVGDPPVIALWGQMLKEGKNPQFFALTDMPKFCMKKSFNILMRILEGQHPLNTTFFYPPPAITSANVKQWLAAAPGLTTSSTFWPEPPYDSMPDSLLNQYFTNGKAPLPFTFKGHTYK
jgi:ribose transport system substrate-binding protein